MLIIFKFSSTIAPKAGSKRKAPTNTKQDKGQNKKKDDEEDGLNSEEKKLALMMLPKKKKALYDKIMHSKKKTASQVHIIDLLLFIFLLSAGEQDVLYFCSYIHCGSVVQWLQTGGLNSVTRARIPSRARSRMTSLGMSSCMYPSLDGGLLLDKQCAIEEVSINSIYLKRTWDY